MILGSFLYYIILSLYYKIYIMKKLIADTNVAIIVTDVDRIEKYSNCEHKIIDISEWVLKQIQIALFSDDTQEYLNTLLK